MKTNELGLDLIKSFEGMRLVPYKDSVGIPTIGIGATFYQDGRKVSMTDKPMTEAQVTDLLRFHIQKFEQGVLGLVKVPLNSNQFSALVSFSFNVGTGNLQTSTLLKKLNALDYTGAADEFLKWAKAKGQELPGLVRRRKAERDLFLKSDAGGAVQYSNRNLLPDGPSESDIAEILKGLEGK
jgi:GH24 family phage-related lysozyme (muramidase)